jgi:[acyl-carrier-protein] S-malonyltransferase
VRWVETVELLAREGVTHTLEVGAGKVLTGLVRNIDSTIVGFNFGLPADWQQIEAIGATAGN